MTYEDQYLIEEVSEEKYRVKIVFRNFIFPDHKTIIETFLSSDFAKSVSGTVAMKKFSVTTGGFQTRHGFQLTLYGAFSPKAVKSVEYDAAKYPVQLKEGELVSEVQFIYRAEGNKIYLVKMSSDSLEIEPKPPPKILIYFLRDLLINLGCKGTVIVADEIERVGNLTSIKGRETLFILRDLINVLVSEESQPAKRGILQGVFIVYAISTFFLGYSGVIEVEGVDFRARADREGRPNVMIGDVPRLDTVLKHSATRLDVELEQGDLKALAELIIGCYQRASDKHIPLSPEELAIKSFERTGTPLARSNVQEIVRILDHLS